MSLTTLAAVAALLPAQVGRSGSTMVPLSFVTDPPGAVASVRFLDRANAEQRAECVTPCTLHIAQASPFALTLKLNGVAMWADGPAPKWCGFFTVKLCPAIIHGRLP